MKKKLLLIPLALLLAISLIAIGCPTAPPETTAPPTTTVPTTPAPKPIVIKALTHLPPNHANNDPVPFFVERVNKQCKGELIIDWLGGPEVMAASDQAEALRTGTIDMILYYPFSFLKPLVPYAEAEGLSELTPWEERESGAFDLWTEVFAQKANIKYVAKMHSQYSFRVWSNVKIEKIEDFKGLTFRVMALYIPFMKALGAAPVTLPPSEMYTAMERGTVDGFMWPEWGTTGFSMQEVTKYRISPPVFQVEAGCFVNLDVWNKIPKHLQEVIMDVGVDIEYIGVARVKWMTQKEWEEIISPAGVIDITLPPGDAKKFTELASSSTWDYLNKLDPEYGPKLKEVLSKK